MKYVYILDDPLEQFNSKYSGFMLLCEQKLNYFDISKTYLTLHYKSEYEIKNNPYYNAFKIIDVEEFRNRYDNFANNKVEILSKILYLIFKNVRVDKSQYHLHKYLYMVVTNIILEDETFFVKNNEIQCWTYGTVFQSVRKNFTEMKLSIAQENSDVIENREKYFINMLTKIYFSNTIVGNIIWDIWNKYKDSKFQDLLEINHSDEHLWRKKFKKGKNIVITVKDIRLNEKKF